MRIMKYLIKYIPLIIISILAALASVYFQLEIPINIGKAIDEIVTGDSFKFNRLLMFSCYAIMNAGFAALPECGRLKSYCLVTGTKPQTALAPFP